MINTTTFTNMIAQIFGTRNPQQPVPVAVEPLTIETPVKFRRPALGKMERGLVEQGAVEYPDCFVIFFTDVTAVILDAQNFYYDIWAHPTYTASVVVLNSETNEWEYYDSGAELLAVLATL